VSIDAGRLIVTAPDALAAAPQIAVAGAAMLDVTGLAQGYVVPAGQAIVGSGTVAGSVIFGRGSTLSPGGVAAGGGAPMPIPVPEPSALGLAALGLATAGCTIASRRFRS